MRTASSVLSSYIKEDTETSCRMHFRRESEQELRKEIEGIVTMLHYSLSEIERLAFEAALRWASIELHHKMNMAGGRS